MADLSNSVIQIAGKGHIYIAPPDTPAPDLYAYTFGNGTTLEDEGWIWIGDTSSENLPEFESDGGDSETKRTWDRLNVRSNRSPVSLTFTFNVVNLGREAMQVAFPNGEYNEAEKAFDVDVEGSVEKAVLIVIEEGPLVSGYLLRRVNLAGSMPTPSLEEFTEITISGTILAPNSGARAVRIFEPRQATGKSVGTPTVTSVVPATAKPFQQVTVNGTNFDGVRTVTVNKVEAAFTKVSDKVITIVVPAKATTGDVIVTNGSGASAAGKTLTIN